MVLTNSTVQIELNAMNMTMSTVIL